MTLKYTKIRIIDREEWSIEYFFDDNGNMPVRDFLNGLDQKTYARFLWSLEQLKIRNIQAHEPLVRHIEGKIWELREESRTNIYRVLYFFYTGRRIILLHGFMKKTQKLPRKELTVAIERQIRFINREEGNS